MTSAEENEIYLRGTISVLLCLDGLESQTSSYLFVEWSVVAHPPTLLILGPEGNKESTFLNVC